MELHSINFQIEELQRKLAELTRRLQSVEMLVDVLEKREPPLPQNSATAVGE
jgi:prefoldin subunit 5